MKFEDLGQEFCSQLQRGQLKGTLAVSKRTAEFLRTLIVHNRYPDAASLLLDVKKTGCQIQEAKPSELVVGNVVRRVLYTIREEERQELQQQGLLSNVSTSPVIILEYIVQDEDASTTAFPFSGALRSLLDLNHPVVDQESSSKEQEKGDRSMTVEKSSKRNKNWKGKQAAIDGINELIDELENIPMQIAQEGLDLLHANEVVMTYGYSETVLQFLILACEKRPELEVIVAEAAPGLEGHRMALKLSESKIKTTIIADAAIFALMARVNKVFVGCHAVLADGGVIARSGIALMAAAAQHHSVPFVVLAGTHKFSPIFPQDPQLTLNEFISSHEIASYAEFPHLSSGEVSVVHPSFDFVSQELINLLLTDHGGVTPSYAYRLMAEFYFKEDYELSIE